MKHEKMKMGMLSHCILGFSLFILAGAVFYLTGNEVPTSYENVLSSSSNSSCNLLAGRWVYDNVSLPFYEEKCSFMLAEFACEAYGRKDLKYRNWRWQPHHCDLPRYVTISRFRKGRWVQTRDTFFVEKQVQRNSVS